MRTDTLFYRLFQDWPGLVLELAGLDPTLPGYQLQATEIKQTSFRLDGVLIPPEEQPDLPIVFIETQFQYDPDFHARWLAQLLLYLYRHPTLREWRAVTLFLSRKTEHGSQQCDPKPAYQWLLTHPWVKRVYLDEEVAKSDLTPGLRLLNLLLTPPNQAVDFAKRLLTEPTAPVTGMPNKQVLASWIETVLVYKLKHLSREEIRIMLELVDVDLKQTRFYQEVFKEGMEEGIEKSRTILTKQLRRRFGDLPNWAMTRLEQANTEQLEVWAEQIFDAESVAALFGTTLD
ncbi:DUF2887 domain-containing protein [Rhodoferax sp. 4810]|nr:DUF2887 domain-containing protein [Rhodoferax jenense]